MSETNVITLFKKQLIDNPNNPAIMSKSEIITYKELESKSNQVAAYLESYNIGKGSLVPILADRSANLIIAILGVVKTGAAYVPIDNKYPDKRKEYIAKQCHAPLILSTLKENNLSNITTKSIDEILQKSNHSLNEITLHSNEPIYVIFTSGTTGQPKGVVVENHSLTHLIEWHNKHFEISANSRSTLMAGVGFDVSQWEIWSALCSGATLCLMDESIRLSAKELLQFYDSNKLTHVFIPTVMVYELISQPQPKTLQLKYLFTAGEKLNPIETDHLPYTVVDYYGPTETTIFATYRLVPSSRLNKELSIGKPIDGCQVFILDEHLKEVAQGEVGELCIAGECLARGYLDSPELTKERFINVPSLNCLVYRSGDLAKILDNSEIQFLGRKDDQVKIRGNRIELGEIENAILRNRNIKTALVLVDEQSGVSDKKLAAFIVPTDSQISHNEIIASIKAGLRTELPDYMLPNRYIVLNELPITANGKTDKDTLKAMLQTSNNANLNEKFDDDFECKIAVIWKKLLGHDDFSSNDNFFDVGGHSLLAMQLVTDISNEMNMTAYIRDIYEHGSIHELANALKKRIGTDTSLDAREPIYELMDDVKLPDNIDFSAGFDIKQITQPKHIFLTGATGFIGVHLLEELLSKTTANIHCVIRGKDSKVNFSRLQQVAKRYQVNITDWQRVEVYAGDLSEPQFNLPDEHYQKLTDLVDIIYHSASAVNFIQPYSYMKKDNVTGLQQIISFAAAKKVKPLMLLSTISVYSWGHLHTGKTMMYEDDDIDQNLPAVATDIGYVRSKWVMEKIADLAESKGLPLMTFRLGYATCHSKTGVFANYQWWGRLIKTCAEHQSMPDLNNLREGLTTVDYMVEAIAAISRNPEALGKKFNLIASPEKNLTLKDFFKLLEQYFNLKFNTIPFKNWVKLWENNRDAPLYPLLSMYKDTMYDNQCVIELYQNTYKWDCSNVKHYLKDTKVVEPEFNKELLKTYIKNVGITF